MRKSGFESEDVPRRLAAVGVRILSADAVDQAQVLQRGEVFVQGGDRHFRVLSQPGLGRKAGEVRVVPVAQKPQHDLGGRPQPALLDGPVGGAMPESW